MQNVVTRTTKRAAKEGTKKDPITYGMGLRGSKTASKEFTIV